MEKSLEERISELEKNQFIQKNVLSFDEASKFLNLSKSYLYKLTSGGQIPHYKPQGKILYFDKEELEIDKKTCKKIGPCGVGKKALYLNSFFIDADFHG